MKTPSTSLVSDPSFARLKQYILEWTGLSYYENRAQDLAQRVQYRLVARQMTSVRDYLTLLEHADTDKDARAERDALIDTVTIGETYFFRFPEQFDALCQQVLPERLKRPGADKTLNIWCAGCSNGAEIYTISILLQKHFGDLLHDWHLFLLGTDINQRFLEQARSGWYASWSLRTLDPAERRALFDYQEQTSRYLLKPGYRRNVHFATLNLIHDVPALPEQGKWDILFCRNVLIYFDAPAIASLLERFAECLAPGGYLFLGHAEPGPVPRMDEWFEIVRTNGALVYRRRFPGESGSVTTSAQPFSFQTSVAVPQPPAPWSPPELPDIPVRGAVPETPVKNVRQTVVRDREEVRLHIRQLLDEDRIPAVLEQLEPLLAAQGDFPDLRHDPVLHYYKALALEREERWEEAEEAIRQALYLDRSFLLAHYQYALLAERRGDLRSAKRSLDTVDNLLRTVSEAPERLQLLLDVSDLTALELAEIVRLKRKTVGKST